MLATLAAAMFDATPQAPNPEDQRAGIYVWAAIVGLIVSGFISITKETRAAAQARA